MDREEKRQNDGVAIKYTTCSGERAACCWESALWLHLLIFFFPVCGTAASLFSFLSFLFALFCLVVFFETSHISLYSFCGCFSSLLLNHSK